MNRSVTGAMPADSIDGDRPELTVKNRFRDHNNIRCSAVSINRGKIKNLCTDIAAGICKIQINIVL